MIGTGIFLLPVNLAQVGSISIFGWLIATAGAAALGLVFARARAAQSAARRPVRLCARLPRARTPASRLTTSTGSATGSAISRLRSRRWAISPSWFRTSTAPPASTIVTALVIWLLTFANILGPRVVGALEAWTMALALIPIVGIALLGWFWFDPETSRASWNVSGGSDWHAISRAASMVLWAYMGIESAAVSAGVIENPKRNMPLATIIGPGARGGGLHAELDGDHGHHAGRGAAELATRRSPRWRASPSVPGGASSSASARCSSPSVRSAAGCCWWASPPRRRPTTACFPKIFARLNRHGVPRHGLIIVSRAHDAGAVRDHVADHRRAVQPRGRPGGDPHHRAVHLFRRSR